MQFDYSERTWKVGRHEYASQPQIGAWELALYREKLQQAAIESPLGKTLPPKNSPKYNKAVLAVMEQYSMRYPKYAALIACECILTPCEGSPPFEEAVKGLDLVQVTNDLGPLISFFFKSASDNIQSALASQGNGKATKAIRQGSRSKTTSRQSIAIAT